MHATTPTVAIPELMTVKEAAELLSLSKATVYRALETGEIPYVRIGRARRLKRADVAALIERNTVARAND